MLMSSLDNRSIVTLTENRVQSEKLNHYFSSISLWTERWFLSSNAKDIGTLYLMFALFSGLVGTAYSVLIRLELSGPGVQYIADNQLYNSIITAHAIVMIFFMVKLSFSILTILYSDNNELIDKYIEIGNNGNNNDNKNPKYVKVVINDPFNNRDIILKVTKKQKGVLLLCILIICYLYYFLFCYNILDLYYNIIINNLEKCSNLIIVPLLIYNNVECKKIEIIKDNKNKSGVYRWINNINGKQYIGSSANLSDRLKQYFSIKYLTRKKSISSISRAIFKYGYSNFTLEILEYCERDKIVILKKEQYYIDTLKPKYNILKLAGSPLGYKHTKEALAKMRNRKLSKEHLAKVLTRILSSSHKAKIRKANLGRKNTEEMKANMRNLIRTDEVKAKLRLNLLNYNLSKGHKIEVMNVKENTSILYESIRKAAISLDTNHNTIRNYILSGKLYKDLFKITKI
jgi:group I intron endonuclease